MSVGSEESAGPARGSSWGFLAPVGAVGDWRVVVTFDVLRRAGLLDELPCTVEERAAQLGVVPDACRRLATLLHRAGVVDFDRSTDRLAAGAAFPDDATARQMAQHANAIRQWSGQLDDRVHGVVPAEGGIRFDRESWLRSMASGAERVADLIAERVLSATPAAARVLELGGGHGEFGRAFARRGVRVTMLDTPDIIGLVSGLGWLDGDGIELIAGDFHEALPAGPFDVVLCFGINHTFGAQKNAALFRRVADVLAPGGVVAISTTLAGSGERGELFAVHMLANRSGGDTHDVSSYRRWLHDAGLELGTVDTIGDEGRVLMLATRPRPVAE